MIGLALLVVVAFGAGAPFAGVLVSLEPLGVQGRVVLPLLRHVVLEENGGDRADALAGCAVDADFGVDVVLRVLGGGVDTVDGANVNARGVFDSDTGFGDRVRHVGPIVLAVAAKVKPEPRRAGRRAW